MCCYIPTSRPFCTLHSFASSLPLHPLTVQASLSRVLPLHHETEHASYSARDAGAAPVKLSGMRPQRSFARSVFAGVANARSLKGPGPTPLSRKGPSACTESLSALSSNTCLAQTRTYSRLSRMSPPLNNAQDPVERTASPYSNPYEIGPKSKILSSRTSNFHSTSLRNMVTINTVNKTALHPGGVQYVRTIDEVTCTRRPQNSSPRSLLTYLAGPSRSTPSSRRNCTRRHTSTMTV